MSIASALMVALIVGLSADLVLDRLLPFQTRPQQSKKITDDKK
jgi:hypothetical protein